MQVIGKAHHTSHLPSALLYGREAPLPILCKHPKCHPKICLLLPAFQKIFRKYSSACCQQIRLIYELEDVAAVKTRHVVTKEIYRRNVSLFSTLVFSVMLTLNLLRVLQ